MQDCVFNVSSCLSRSSLEARNLNVDVGDLKVLPFVSVVLRLYT